MESDKPLSVWIGWDSREPVCSYVAEHSIKKRTDSDLKIQYLKHRDLSKKGIFNRPWMISGENREMVDLIDGKSFSTEFSHTRFLVPHLMNYQGWALSMDCDMIFLSDIKRLFDLCDNRYAVMVVKHNYQYFPPNTKMDGREQRFYRRKNWSSFVLWNCSHPANAYLTPDKVNVMKGQELHSFYWLTDNLIGELPATYNYIAGISPKLPAEMGNRPDVIHYTAGGPWFEEHQNVTYSHMWIDEYEDWQAKGAQKTKAADVPSMRYEA